MRKVFYIIAGAAVVLSSCVRNNLPYPTIDPGLKVTVEGAKAVNINMTDHIITAELEETTDICNVNVTGLDIDSPDKVTVSRCEPPMVGRWDLSSPKEFIISNYPDTRYPWSLEARQNIERRFSVEGQIGASVIDLEHRRVLVYVTKKTKITDITVKDMKLGPEGITSYSKTTADKWNLWDHEEVTVTAHGRSETWSIYAEKSLVNVSWESIDGWSKCAWLSASGVEGNDNGFYYRMEGRQEWILVEPSAVKHEGGRFQACIDGLQPLTSYECYAFSGDETTQVETFTTENIQELPNGGLNTFSHAESSKYFSFFDPQSTLWHEKWWDSGNIGSTAVGESGVICTPDTEDKVEGEASARLNSKYVVIKFAAGNLFSGEFDSLVGTKGGKVNFGRPWNTRPRKLKLSVKTICGPIDHKDGDIDEVNIGDPDVCEIFVALGCWDFRKYGGNAISPVQVNTTEKSTLFNPDGPDVIGYGKFNTSVSSEGWMNIEIPIEYRSHSVKPTHIIISCASSKYGDFFTGCSQNTMWIDNMRLEY